MIRQRVGDAARTVVWSTAGALAGRVRYQPRAGMGTVSVLPPSDGGSLGDEAMFSGLLGLLDGRRVVAVPYQSLELRRMPADGDAAPGLESRMAGLAHLRLLLGSSETYVIGADVLDGHYSDRKTLLRLRFADLAAKSGSMTSIVGFSMNANPSIAARAAIADLDPRVRLVARDPISARRTAGITGRPVETAADLAFLVESQRPKADFSLPGTINLGFAPNYLMVDQFGGVDRFVDIVVNCLGALIRAQPGLGIVLVPHDSRGSLSDFTLVEALADRLPPDRSVPATFVDTPGHVRWVVAQLDGLVSARVHAAIGALGERTPVAVLGYQDKAEGILGMFGLDDWVAHPKATLSDPSKFVELAKDLLRRRNELSEQIDGHLSEVIAAARRNIA